MLQTKNLKQGAMIYASPHQVYEALIDSKKHTKFTGQKARISRKVGGTFSAFGKYISGKNLELLKDRKIVQAWRESTWPKGHFSEVRFLLKKVRGGTKLMFSHKGIPAKKFKSIANGWKFYYWQPLKKMLDKTR